MKGLTKLPPFPREKRRGVVALLVRRFEEERWVRVIFPRSRRQSHYAAFLLDINLNSNSIGLT